jgi:hypothetical protein
MEIADSTETTVIIRQTRRNHTAFLSLSASEFMFDVICLKYVVTVTYTELFKSVCRLDTFSD